MIALTASQISKAKSSSVPVKLSGEYSKVNLVSGACSATDLTKFAASVAIFIIPWRSARNTTSRCSVEVEL